MPFLGENRWFQINLIATGGSGRIPALFVDRDGVIISEKHYIRDPDDVEVLPGIDEKLAEINRLKVPIIIVTNQSGIGRGLFGWEDYDRVHARITETLSGSDPFAAVYANSYLPDDNSSDWRKPNTGMFLQAAKDMAIDLSSSLMVGDKWIDLEAANRAGVGHLAHVLTGHGKSERAKVMKSFPGAAFIDTLADLSLDLFQAPRNPSH